MHLVAFAPHDLLSIDDDRARQACAPPSNGSANETAVHRLAVR
jgi:hypothetical protein